MKTKRKIVLNSAGVEFDVPETYDHKAYGLRLKEIPVNVTAPVVETPVVETPVVETPVVETPVVETPVVETKKVTPKTPKQNEVKA